jgi:hypothetical protein
MTFLIKKPSFFKEKTSFCMIMVKKTRFSSKKPIVFIEETRFFMFIQVFNSEIKFLIRNQGFNKEIKIFLFKTQVLHKMNQVFVCSYTKTNILFWISSFSCKNHVFSYKKQVFSKNKQGFFC